MQIYILEPPWHKWVDQLLWTAIYLTSVTYSATLALVVPRTVEMSTGALLAYFATGVTILGSLLCLTGVTFRKQGLELAGSWFVLPSLLVYDGALWISAYRDNGPLWDANTVPIAFLVLFTVLLYCGRILRLITTYENNVKLVALETRATESNKTLMGEE